MRMFLTTTLCVIVLMLGIAVVVALQPERPPRPDCASGSTIWVDATQSWKCGGLPEPSP
jgi:hypothetical protein